MRMIKLAVDEIYVEEKARELLTSLGLDLKDENLCDTSKRIAKMYVKELFCGLYDDEPNITTFPNGNGYDEIISTITEEWSMCAHHFLPFKVRVAVGYVPRERLVGLSKIPRVIKYFCRRPQIQEKLTDDIAEYLEKKLNPLGIIVQVKGIHLCMTARGVERRGEMATSVIRGVFRNPPGKKNPREEFQAMIAGEWNRPLGL